ncbi:hypothetical protein WJX72_001358 [[Myrmecia] bisecta]|uniref:Eukaryotic translation initiation factor 3 subunit K n=1 Tax=[Myrmecia] bisecta TaxID=41462 RepID=A0AAW1QP90_9CHLO
MVVGADAYDHRKLPELERKVADQVNTGTYDLDANLALLRLYNVQPERIDLRLVASILIKAMMQLPKPDFALALHMIPERLQEEQPVAALIALTQHLEGARFQKYWEAVDACRDIVKAVPGYYEAVRAYILQAIQSTCQKVTRATLAQSLRADGETLDKLIQDKVASEGWSVNKTPGGGAIISLPKNDMNTIRPPQSAQGMRLNTMLPMLVPAAQ